MKKILIAVLLAWPFVPVAAMAQIDWGRTPPAPAAQSGAGMNSPEVIQALDLIHRAAQIEMIAANVPNNLQVQRTATVMAHDLRWRAAIIMQVWSAGK